EVPATLAGMFTTNQVCAAPVKVSIAHAKRSRARAIVVNSGNANACTGERGFRDAREMAALTAKQFGLRTHDVLVASTGRIGISLPMENVRRGIIGAAQAVNATTANADAVAEAIITSDTHPKQIALELVLGGKR